ncbi:hypothetical protein ANCCAN_01732 [Ancylostoma caninum]|uniref:Uncharacterized protein n=1 Tax=Ancylostoma caninum TaxID=29170 RepID=A0A368H9J7_ANCCA|nr:hypothetical protein ANCCAN_01732 [Ancylostoma caninum]
MEVVNCEKKECLPRNEKAKKPEIAANKSAQAIQDTPVAAAEKEAKTQSTERIERTQQTDE